MDDHSGDNGKRDVNRLPAAVNRILQDWCKVNSDRLARLSATQAAAAELAMTELVDELRPVRDRLGLAEPVVFKASNIKAAYDALCLDWHRSVTPDPLAELRDELRGELEALRRVILVLAAQLSHITEVRDLPVLPEFPRTILELNEVAFSPGAGGASGAGGDAPLLSTVEKGGEA